VRQTASLEAKIQAVFPFTGFGERAGTITDRREVATAILSLNWRKIEVQRPKPMTGIVNNSVNKMRLKG
jgi:hypothetical protein